MSTKFLEILAAIVKQQARGVAKTGDTGYVAEGRQKEGAKKGFCKNYKYLIPRFFTWRHSAIWPVPPQKQSLFHSSFGLSIDVGCSSQGMPNLFSSLLLHPKHFSSVPRQHISSSVSPRVLQSVLPPLDRVLMFPCVKSLVKNRNFKLNIMFSWLFRIALEKKQSWKYYTKSGWPSIFRDSPLILGKPDFSCWFRQNATFSGWAWVTLFFCLSEKKSVKVVLFTATGRHWHHNRVVQF